MDKKLTDISAIAALIIAIASGFVLHTQLYYRFIYYDTFMWPIHEIAGIVFAICVIHHCVRHKSSF